MIERYKEMFFSTRGRINRMTFFKYNAFLLFASIVVSLVPVIVVMLIFGEDSFAMDVLSFVLGFISFVAYLTIAVRRLHDLDKKEWLVFLSIIPVIDIFLGLYLLFAPGTPGSNQYGEEPY